MDVFKNQDKRMVIIGLIIILVAGVIFIKGNFLNNDSADSITGKNNTGNESSSPAVKNSSYQYRNQKYGFQLDVPESWKGYSAIEDLWEAQLIDNPKIKFHGPKIIIRNPAWTEDRKRQDVPIMIFNKEQWQLVQSGSISLGAAPIGPSKLGENDRYVFALPARWIGFTDDLGQEEAEEVAKTFKILD